MFKLAFPKKLDYLKPLINEGIEKEGKEFLLGLLELPEKQYETILNYASALIKKEKLMYIREKNMIISVALVFFAIKEFQGKQFWDEFSQRIDAEEMYVQKVCKPAFESFCYSNDLYFHTGRKNKGYVTSILTHAIIPKISIDIFLEFLEDIYFKDLEETYENDEVEQLVEYMHRLFSRFIEEDDIRLDIQGSKMTIARQQLPKAFRIAFVKSAGIVSPIIEKYLFYINELNYSRTLIYNFNTRFDNYFKYYVNNISKLLETANNQSRIANKGIKKFATAQFSFKDDNLRLVVPKQIIDSEYIKDTVYLNIYNENKLIDCRQLRLTKSRLLFKTEAEEIDLNSFYGNISYEIKTELVTIFNSKDKLFRDYLLFNSNAEEVTANRLKSEMYKILCYRDDDLNVINGEKSIRSQSDYTVNTVFLEDDTILKLGGYVITPNNRQLISEFNEKSKYSGVQGIGSGGSDYSVYSEVPQLQLIIPEGKSFNDYVVSLNGDNYYLNRASSFSLSDLTDGSGAKIAQVQIKDSLIQPFKYYSLAIRVRGNHQSIMSKKMCILPNLHFTFDKLLYYKDKQAKLSKFDVGDSLSCNEKLPLKINLKKNNNVIVTIEKKSIKLKIEIPKLYWQLGRYFSGQNVTDIWYKSIKDQVLTVSYSKPLSKIYLVDTNEVTILEGKYNEMQNHFDLSDYFLVERPCALTIGVNAEEQEITIATVYYQPTLKNVKIDYYESDRFSEGLFIQGIFIGEGDLKAKLLDNKDNLIKEYELKHSFNVFDQNLKLEIGKYTVKIILPEKDDFFGLSTEDNVLYEKEFIVGDPFIVSTYKKVLKVQKCNTYDGVYPLDNFYLQNMRYSKTQGYYEADGFYFITDWDTNELKKWYFTKYNPFIMKIRNENELLYELEIEDKDRDGLIYDSHSKHVNPKFIDKEPRFKLIDTIIIVDEEVK